MMSATLDVPVAVVASFRNGRMQPQLMQYNGRTVRFLGTSLLYAEGEGEQRTVYCSVYTSGAVYTLTFKPRYLTWRLLTVSDEDLYQDG